MRNSAPQSEAKALARPDEPSITVVLCTFNRSESLQKTLDSLANQILPEGVPWEVIVVDNNSKDSTRAVVDAQSHKYPNRVRYVFESEQGLSRARNTGIRQARGEIIAFIDDDVIADPMWLQNLTASFKEEAWSGSGGRILPPCDFRPPDWLTLGGAMDLGGALALFDLGDRPGELERPPYGTNMAFRKKMFQKYGMFRVELGRCGTSLLSGEDIDFGRRVMLSGECLRYEPSAVVYHPVSIERLSKRYFRAWWFDFGRTRIIERPLRPRMLGIPREYISIVNLLLRFLPLRTIQWLLTVQTRPRFYRKCQVWLTIGEIVQNYRQATISNNSARTGRPVITKRNLT